MNFTDTLAASVLNGNLTGGNLENFRDIQGLCTDIFLIAIRMREAEDLGDPVSLRKLIRYYLDLFGKNCQTAGISEDSMHHAMYALVAFVDETVLSIPGASRDYWLNHPLQLDLFGNNIAGEEFYGKLDKLLLETHERNDLLEIYYLCLALGFEGKYKLSHHEERLAVMKKLGRKLRNAKKDGPSELSPHGSAYLGANYSGSSALPFPLWFPALLTLGVVIACYVYFYFVNSSHTAIIIETLRGKGF